MTTSCVTSTSTPAAAYGGCGRRCSSRPPATAPPRPRGSPTRSPPRSWAPCRRPSRERRHPRRRASRSRGRPLGVRSQRSRGRPARDRRAAWPAFARGSRGRAARRNGKRADRNPLGAAAAETLELGLAWLAGHGIDRIVLVHADWLRDQIAAELCAFAALTGIELACIVGDPRADPFLRRHGPTCGLRSTRIEGPRWHSWRPGSGRPRSRGSSSPRSPWTLLLTAGRAAPRRDAWRLFTAQRGTDRSDWIGAGALRACA